MTAAGNVQHRHKRWSIWALAVVGLATAIAFGFTALAGGPNAVAVQLASSANRFTELFRGTPGHPDLHLVEGTRRALRFDYVFIVFYTAWLLLLVLTTGKRRPLGRRAPRVLAAIAVLVAGISDVLENHFTNRALDQLVGSKVPDAALVTRFAMTKWIGIAAVVAYLLVRALGTPRRRRTPHVTGTRYQLIGGRNGVTAAAPDEAAVREQIQANPAMASAPTLDSPWQTISRHLRLSSLGRLVVLLLRPVVSLLREPPPAGDEPKLSWRLDGEADEITAKGCRPCFKRSAPHEPRQPGGGPIGIACSGGGIRSACFTLGALQVLRERGVLKKASYVTAASGGGYLAAGWAIAASSHPSACDNVFAPDSPEEAWLRRHSNLLPDVRTALVGVGRALFGLFVNLLVIWLVIIAVTRPVGWLEHVVHPELRSRQPYISIVKEPGVCPAEAPQDAKTGCPFGASEPVIGDGRSSDVPAVCFGPAQPLNIDAASGQSVQTWSVTPTFQPAQVNVGKVKLPQTLVTSTCPAANSQPSVTSQGRSQTVSLKVVDGLVGVVGGKLVVLRQPFVSLPDTILDAIAMNTSNGNTGESALFVSRQPRLRIVDPSVPGTTPVGAQMRVVAPRIDQHSGTTGRPDLAYPSWMWWLVGAAVAAFALAALSRPVIRPVRAQGLIAMRTVSTAAAALAVVAVAVMIVIPFLIHELPSLLARLVTALPGPDTSATQSSDATVVVVAGGTGVLSIATVVRTLRGPLEEVVHRKPLLVVKIVVLVVFVVMTVVLLVESLAIGAANGPGGHLVGAWAGHIHFPADVLRSKSDVVRWFAALAALAIWRNANDAHSLSLFPFYKHRMSEAFSVERRPDGTAANVPYEIELAWATTDKQPLPAKGFGRFCLDGKGTGPELVLCATVNAYGPGETPSSRRATPFTFSPTLIGGPDVGYLPTHEYLDALGLSRRKDVTIPASLAIAGAAFSPGMGERSMGPIDHVLAITNARLGVWIPHPAYVAEQRLHDPDRRWHDRPGWPWFLRELIGRFRLTTPYIYLTDGGHWENLGMVELLRRGCRDVVIISAAGDGAMSFATIGQAIALAREELDLEIAINLEPMRAEWTPPDANPKGPSLRRRKDGPPTAVAPSAYRRGVIRDLRADAAPYGTIVILEANVSATLPWDVASWAESNPIFPDDPTLDQNFNHRQFESYRRLGRLQMTEAFADSKVCEAFEVDRGPQDPAKPTTSAAAVETTRFFHWFQERFSK